METAKLDAVERRIHLDVCRDEIKTLPRVLGPNSLVALGGRKRWWPTAPSRIAEALRANGHRVVFVEADER